MAQPREKVELVEGAVNELPQLYNPSVRTGGNALIVATTIPHLGTSPLEPRSPNATTVAFRMEWEDAIRLAVEISKMAEVVGVRLPKGVLYRGELQ